MFFPIGFKLRKSVLRNWEHNLMDMKRIRKINKETIILKEIFCKLVESVLNIKLFNSNYMRFGFD